MGNWFENMEPMNIQEASEDESSGRKSGESGRTSRECREKTAGSADRKYEIRCSTGQRISG